MKEAELQQELARTTGFQKRQKLLKELWKLDQQQHETSADVSAARPAAQTDKRSRSTEREVVLA